MTTEVPRSVLGLPDYIEHDHARSLTRALETIWQAANGSPPGNLDDDLTICRRWFDPVAQGQRLRRELALLPLLPEDLADPGEPMTITVDSRRRLVTPEGRCALSILQQLVRDGEDVAIPDSLLVPYDRMLAALYREWSRHRLRSVIALLSGDTKPLQIPAAGVVIALLVNRCTSPERALKRFASGRARELVDQAFFTSVEAFAGILSTNQRAHRSDPRLISGWMLYEARRRLDGCLVMTDARAGADGLVWIRLEDEDKVISAVMRDLARGHRKHATTDRFALAFDALVEHLRESLPRLASFGLVHERPGNTARLRGEMLASLSSFLEDKP
jgi:hypothetical protein